MRSPKDWTQIFGWGFFIWGLPLVASAIVVITLCSFSQCDAQRSSVDSLLAAAADMTALLGVVTAIMVAVIAALYVSGLERMERGFGSFDSWLNQLREFSSEVDGEKGNFSEQCQGTLDKWIERSQALVAYLRRVTPEWDGFSSDPETMHVIHDFRNKTETITRVLNGWTSNNRPGRKSLFRLSELRYAIIRGIQFNLFIVSRGVIGRRLVSKLLILSISLSFLLVGAIIIRGAVGFADNNLFEAPVALNLYLYSFLPISAVCHTAAFMLAVFSWWHETKTLEKLWPPLRNDDTYNV